MAAQPERAKFSAKLNFFDDMLRNQLRNDLNNILLEKGWNFNGEKSEKKSQKSAVFGEKSLVGVSIGL